MIILLYFIFFPPLCCYSLTEFFKALLEHPLQEFLLSTCKPEGNSCLVLHMAIISVVCENNPHDKRDNGPLMRCFLGKTREKYPCRWKMLT